MRAELVCVECGRGSAARRARAWKAYLTTDVDEASEAVVYCPECAERVSQRLTGRRRPGHLESTEVARACVFCGTERELTIEHAWPEWIVKRWGRGDYRHIHSTEAGVQREYGARTLEVRVKRVCKVCNEGWLSDLENDTKRLLVWLMELRSLHMSGEDQAQVALWATKTAMMLGFTHPQRRNIPDSDYYYVYEHRQPPPFTHVWLARYAGRPDEPMYRHHALRLTSDSGRIGNAYGATMCIEHLVLRVFGHDLDDELSVAPMDAQMDQVQRLIRPAAVRCTWPPSGAMDAAGLRAYADGFLSPSEGR